MTTSSDLFFADVRRFFSLLDLDDNQRIDHLEATLGLSHCFEAVHQTRQQQSTGTGTGGETSTSTRSKEQAVQEQVKWLFSATQHDMTAAATASATSASSSSSSYTQLYTLSLSTRNSLTLPEFESCYHRLLQSAYEMEVLHLDLTRAITALTDSNEWTNMKSIIQSAQRVYRQRMTGQQVAEETQIQQIKQHCFASLSPASQSGVGSSKKQHTLMRYIAQIMSTPESVLTEEVWITGWKQILSITFNYTRVLEDLDRVLTGAQQQNGDAAHTEHMHTS